MVGSPYKKNAPYRTGIEFSTYRYDYIVTYPTRKFNPKNSIKGNKSRKYPAVPMMSTVSSIVATYAIAYPMYDFFARGRERAIDATMYPTNSKMEVKFPTARKRVAIAVDTPAKATSRAVILRTLITYTYSRLNSC